MAKKAKQNDDLVIVPDDFKSIRAELCLNFFKKEKGAVLQGWLKGRFVRKDNRGKDAPYYQIETTAPCKSVLMPMDEDGQGFMLGELGVGETVSIDESTALQELREYAEKLKESTSNLKVEVFIVVGEKIPLVGGRSFWDVKPHVRIVQ